MTALVASYGGSWSVSLYIIAMAAITFIGVSTIKEQYGRDLYEVSGDDTVAEDKVAQRA
jgi:MFS transporter, MHS family, shikimate and dehydroshikimate transport protein